jgi:hypothetical protein
LFQHIEWLTFSIHRDRRIFLANLSPAQVIQTKVGHDAIDPGIERTFKAETAKVPVGLEKCLLINILGFGVRAGKVHGQSQHGLVVVPHQLLEGSAVAALRGSVQRRQCGSNLAQP